jgi:predicted transposase YdaD
LRPDDKDRYIPVMPHPFDSVNKHMVQGHPADWFPLGRLRRTGPLEVIDADLSVVSTAADKLIRVGGRYPYVAHFEFQAGCDLGLDIRVLVYNVLAKQRLGLPVKSVVFLLRPEAMTSAIKGRVYDRSGKEHRLEFVYKLVRVWEIPVNVLLTGGLGTLPLAPISAVAEPQLPRVIDAMKRRLDLEAPEEAKELWTATRIMMGLRWSPDRIGQLLKGVQGMKESTTYQEIIREGFEEGRTEQARSSILQSGTKKFGRPSAAVKAALNEITDHRQLQDLVDQMVVGSAKTWAELLRGTNRHVSRH